MTKEYRDCPNLEELRRSAAQENYQRGVLFVMARKSDSVLRAALGKLSGYQVSGIVFGACTDVETPKAGSRTIYKTNKR